MPKKINSDLWAAIVLIVIVISEFFIMLDMQRDIDAQADSINYRSEQLEECKRDLQDAEMMREFYKGAHSADLNDRMMIYDRIEEVCELGCSGKELDIP